MANCLSKEALAGLRCQGRSPWLGENYKENCSMELRTLMRGSTNIYYPEVISVLTIPPWSSEIQKVIDQDCDMYKTLFESSPDKTNIKLVMENIFKSKSIDDLYKCKFEDFWKQIIMRFQPNNSEKVTEVELRQDEYKALIGSDMDDPYYKTEDVNVHSELQPYINSVKLVKRLREVQVLKGFRRIVAFDEDGGNENRIGKLSTRSENWLPAVELLGG